MSDNWQQKPEYKNDVQQANDQVGLVDKISKFQNAFRGTPIGSALSFGRTDFEDHDLNAMIDLVHHSNPEHLETASKALWDARTAIHDAATDLETHLRGVDWQGEGADSFHKWTSGLIDWTKGLATFADVAATEISAAASGLASVRAAMPPRDTRPASEQKRPTQLPKTKQVDGNADYAAALAVEKNRQEAINQVNRLASFYSVSASALGMAMASDPKPYSPIPDVGVPQPTRRRDGVLGGSGSTSSTPTTVRRGVAASHGSAAEGHHGTTAAHGTPTVDGTGAGGHVPPLKEVPAPSPPSGHDVGTEINTTTTLPPQTPAVPSGPPAPTSPTTAGGGGQMPLPPGPMSLPVAPTSGRTPGYGPTSRFPVSAQGRTGPSGTGNGRVPQGPAGQTGRSVAGGRAPQGPMGQAARAAGRATPAGQPGARGATQSGRAPMGRGVTGGTPRPANTPGGRAGTPGLAGMARNGVVGGKPVTGRTSGGTANPRVPRGMVVGAEEPVTNKPSKGALGQRGVVGTPTAKAEPGASQAVLRSAGNPEGAIGAPRNTAGSALKGSETGAKGLGRGAVGGRQGAGGEPGRAGAPAEKEEHRSSRQRRDVPQTSD
ncbi:hypothetical protein ACF1BE_25135 [Streptomyces sp. NPDC014991]|uniref:WXG100 family type VII secretion target n=1 Tax=Streptomyces sp. NPDC014991 TaxID=3364935 RepID=UPI0036F940B4